MAENVGYATLQIIPSFRGLDAALRSALGGVAPGIGASAGAGFAASFSKALKIGAPLAVGAAIGAGFVAASKAASEFEFRMSAVGAVSGATGTELDALREKALQLGADTSFTASESARAMEELVKAGLSVQQVLGGAADAAVALAAAGEVDLEKAATIASQALNAFRLEAEQLPGVADTIAGAANSSAIDVEQFGYSLSQTAASAAIAGFSFEDTATAIAALGNAGIVGSDAGTSLKTMFARLTPQTKRQKEAMELLGIVTEDGTNRFYDQEGSLRSLSEIAGILQQSFAGLTKQDISTYLYKIFGSDAIRAGAVFLQEGAAGVDALAESIQKISAEDVAAARLDNLRGDVEKLKGSIETLLIEGGTPLNEWLRELTQAGTAAVNWLNDPPKGFTDWLRDAWETGVRYATPIVEDLVRAGENLWDLTIGLARDLRPLAEALATIGGAAIVGGLTIAAEALADLTGFVADHRDIVIAAAAAWLAWRAGVVGTAVWTAAAAAVGTVTTSVTYLIGAIRGLAATRGITTLAASFGVLQTSITGVATAAVTAQAAVAGALAGIAIGAGLAYMSIQRSAENAKEANREFLDSIDFDPASRDFRDLSQGIVEMYEEVRRLDKLASGSDWEQLWQNLNPRVDNDIEEALRRQKELDGLIDDASVTVDALQALAEKSNLNAQGVDLWVNRLNLDPATQSVSEMAEAIRDAQRVSSTGAPETEQLADSFRVLQDETASATDELDAFKDAMDALIGVNIGFEQAQIGFAESIFDLKNAAQEAAAAGEDFSTNLFGGDLASLETRSLISDLAESALDVAAAFGESGASLEEITWKLADMREQIIQAGEETGIARSDMEAYLDTLGLTPENIVTTLNLEGADAVGAAIDATTTPRDVDVSASLDPASWAAATRYIGQTTEPKTITLLSRLDEPSRAMAERYIAQLTQQRTIDLILQLDPASRALAERYIGQGQLEWENRSALPPKSTPFTPPEPTGGRRGGTQRGDIHLHTRAATWDGISADLGFDLKRMGLV